MKYLIVGDVHGVWSNLAICLNKVTERGIEFDEVIQVGDFGVYEGYLKPLKQKLFKINFKKPIHFIDGNHEDHFYLYKSVEKMKKMGVYYHNRGSITKLEDGTKIGWLGGAFNVDRPQYQYPDGSSNFPHPDEIVSMANAVKKSGGVDLMVTHTLPMGIGIGIHGHPFLQTYAKKFIGDVGYKSASVFDIGDEPLLTLWNLLEGVRPKTWVFGHVHQHAHSKVGYTDFWSVNICPSTILIYDTKTKEILI